MAIVLIEELLVGLEDVKESITQAAMTLESLIDDLHPDFGPHLSTVLTLEFLRPLQVHMVAVEQLQEHLSSVS